MVDIQSLTAEIKRGKKKKETTGQQYNGLPSPYGGHKKPPDKNIMACSIPQGGHKEEERR